MYIEMSYFVYLFISITMTIWVARTLSLNGLVFLVEGFGGNEALARSVNHLLVVGFYLVNFGYILLALETQETLASMRDCIEFLSRKIGFVLVFLGILHLFNIYVISRWRRSSKAHTSQASNDANITNDG